MRHLILVIGLLIEELVNSFINNVYKLYSTPSTIISNRGTQFISDFWRRLSKRLKITLQLSLA
jgi:hypothetical protein